MKKIGLFLISVILLSACSSPTQKLNKLEPPIILVAKSTEMDMLMNPSIYTITVKGANGTLLTLSNCYEANSFGGSYDVNDTIIK